MRGCVYIHIVYIYSVYYTCMHIRIHRLDIHTCVRSRTFSICVETCHPPPGEVCSPSATPDSSRDSGRMWILVLVTNLGFGVRALTASLPSRAS